MTFAVIITVAVSLALFGVSLLVRAQVTTMQDFWYDKVEVSIFLCSRSSDAASCASGAVTDAQRDQIRADLESLRPLVEEVYYESKTEAFERFQEQFANSPIVENVTEEALPESFRVKLSDPTQYDVVASAFAGRPGIEQVNDQRKILDQFFRLLNGLQAIALTDRDRHVGRHGAADRQHHAGCCLQQAPRNRHHALGRRLATSISNCRSCWRLRSRPRWAPDWRSLGLVAVKIVRDRWRPRAFIPVHRLRGLGCGAGDRPDPAAGRCGPGLLGRFLHIAQVSPRVTTEVYVTDGVILVPWPPPTSR